MNNNRIYHRVLKTSLNPESVIRFSIRRGHSTKFRHYEDMLQIQFLVCSLSRFPLNCNVENAIAKVS